HQRREVDAVLGVPGGRLDLGVQADLAAAGPVQSFDEPYLFGERADPKPDPGIARESRRIERPVSGRPATLVERQLAQLGEIEIEHVEMTVGAAAVRVTPGDVRDLLEVYVVEHD